MSSLGKMEERLSKKIEQKEKLITEIKELEEKIQEEKESTLIKKMRGVKLTSEQYQKLAKGIENMEVFKYLEEIEALQCTVKGSENYGREEK